MTIEAAIAEEIEVVEARLEALRAAQDVLAGTRRHAAADSALSSSAAALIPTQLRVVKRRGGRRSDAEKRQICNRANELRSCYAAAQEAGVRVTTVQEWIEAGFSDYPGLPGNDLPAEAADELRPQRAGRG